MLPNRPLTDKDLNYYAKKLNVPNFKGVFMRDTLPKTPPKLNESAILNLDVESNEGTHWVAYKKRGRNVHYFDSFGSLKPPKELIKYLGGKCRIIYNNNAYQTYEETNCGHLCLKFLQSKTL